MMTVGVLTRFAIAAALTGCGVKLTDPQLIAGPGPDAGVDARPIDAAPDAAPTPCTGGAAAMRNPDNMHCYMFFTTKSTRAAAVATCAAQGGATLASITSQAEHQFAANLVGANEAMLGGNDMTSEGMFRWDNNDVFNYTAWRSGEPNNANGGFEEDCIVMQGQLISDPWDDRPCDNSVVATATYAFLCERP
jgi:hypothetical protein